MADFGAAGLLALAKARFGERTLRAKIRGADQVDPDDADDAADAQLKLIARGVLGRLQTALQASSGWPLPGSWPEASVDEDGNAIPTGTLFRERWPYDLLEHAIQLLWVRVLMTGEQVTDQERRLAGSVEKYFQDLEAGQALGIGGATDVSEPLVLTARDRAGNALIPGMEDKATLLDDIRGYGWDRAR